MGSVRVPASRAVASRGGGERLRIGVVGAGLVAQAVHLPLLRQLDDHFALRALADPSAVVRERVAAAHGVPAVHRDHLALIDAGGIDALVVCAPNALHEDVVLDALDAGLHVLVEKPLCLSAAGARRIADRAERARRVVQVGYMKRFAPAYEALLAGLPPRPDALVHARTLTCDPRLARRYAPPGLVTADDLRPAERAALRERTARAAHEAIGDAGEAGAWAYSEAWAGALVHDVNAMCGILGALGISGERAVDAFGDGEGELAGGTVALPGGARWSLAWMLLEHAGAFTQELELHARDGVRLLRLPAPYARQASARYRHTREDDEGARSTGLAAPADPYERQLLHFHACVTTGAPCRTPAAQAERDLALLAALFRLQHERQPRVAAGVAA